MPNTEISRHSSEREERGKIISKLSATGEKQKKYFFARPLFLTQSMTDDFGREVSSQAKNGWGGGLPLIYFHVGLLLRIPLLLFAVGLVLPASLLRLFPQSLPRPGGTKEKRKKTKLWGKIRYRGHKKEIGEAYSSMVRAEGAFLLTLRANCKKRKGKGRRERKGGKGRTRGGRGEEEEKIQTYLSNLLLIFASFIFATLSRSLSLTSFWTPPPYTTSVKVSVVLFSTTTGEGRIVVV